MKDLPQNELLSAYLDGELTAAEQADVEQLLAANPAARRLLDELRLLSTAIQSLPQQRVGEDLSQHVLRMAERRMLTEGEPGDSSGLPEAPVPLSRTLRDRFANRRTAIWTGLAVAIAVMIAVTERRQSDIFEHREVARATPKSRTPINAPGSPPTMQAWPAATDKLKESDLTRVARKSSVGEPPSGRKSARYIDGAAKMPAVKMEPRFGNTLSMHSQERIVTEEREAKPDASPFEASSRLSLDRSEANKGGFAIRRGGVVNGKSAKVGEERFDKSGPEVLVVYCSISPDAAKKKAFDKLLDANGIAWRRELPQGDKQLTAAFGSKADRDAKGKPQRDQDESPLADEYVKQRTAGEAAELVYVEATPAQIKAALAGLDAQPNLFLSVLIGPTQMPLSESLAYQFKSNRDGANADLANRNDAFGRQNQLAQTAPRPAQASPAPPVATKPADGLKSDAAVDSAASSTATQSAPLSGKDASAPVPPRETQQRAGAGIAALPPQIPQSSPAGGQLGLKQQGERQGEPQAAAMQFQAMPMQRVLFVLRIGGPSPAEVRSKAAAESAEPAPAANATPKPAE